MIHMKGRYKMNEMFNILKMCNNKTVTAEIRGDIILDFIGKLDITEDGLMIMSNNSNMVFDLEDIKEISYDSNGNLRIKFYLRSSK